MNTRKARKSWQRIALLLCVSLLLVLACSLIYSLSAIRAVRADGIYTSPQEGVTQRAHRYYQNVTKIDIRSARVNSHNGSNPHIWFVIYEIYADRRADDSPLAHNAAHEGGGNYYLHMKDGWVYVPEGYFPEMLGLWMKILSWAGA